MARRNDDDLCRLEVDYLTTILHAPPRNLHASRSAWAIDLGGATDRLVQLQKGGCISGKIPSTRGRTGNCQAATFRGWPAVLLHPRQVRRVWLVGWNTQYRSSLPAACWVFLKSRNSPLAAVSMGSLLPGLPRCHGSADGWELFWGPCARALHCS